LVPIHGCSLSLSHVRQFPRVTSTAIVARLTAEASSPKYYLQGAAHLIDCVISLLSLGGATSLTLGIHSFVQTLSCANTFTHIPAHFTTLEPDGNKSPRRVISKQVLFVNNDRTKPNGPHSLTVALSISTSQHQLHNNSNNLNQSILHGISYSIFPRTPHD
jgi:hypothetical protein